MKRWFTGALLASCCALAQTPHIIMVSDVPIVEGALNDMESLLVKKLSDQLQGEFSVEFQVASRSREWRLLEKRENICLYNKTKNAQREQLAYFSRLPIAVFPPNRLIMNKPLDFPGELDLEGLVHQQGLQIGVVDGRSYGGKMDAEIARLKKYLYVLGGEHNAVRLQHMMEENRLDGIIEFSAAFANHLPKDKDITDYFIYPLKDSGDYVLGYIACARSELGNHVIELIDKKMATPEFQADIRASHLEIFPANEKPFLQTKLKVIFTQE